MTLTSFAIVCFDLGWAMFVVSLSLYALAFALGAINTNTGNGTLIRVLTMAPLVLLWPILRVYVL